MEPLHPGCRGNEEGGSVQGASHAFWQHSTDPRKILATTALKLTLGFKLPQSPSSQRIPLPGWFRTGWPLLLPLPCPQAQHAARAARPTGQSPEWPGPARVKNCSAAGGGTWSPQASATSAMPAASPLLTLTLPAPKEQWSEWPCREQGCPLPAGDFFQALHRHQLGELLPVGSAVLGRVLPHW